MTYQVIMRIECNYILKNYVLKKKLAQSKYKKGWMPLKLLAVD